MAERGKTSQFSYVLLNDITQFKHVMEESLSSLLKLTCPFALSMYQVFCHYDNILNKYNSTIHKFVFNKIMISLVFVSTFEKVLLTPKVYNEFCLGSFAKFCQHYDPI